MALSICRNATEFLHSYGSGNDRERPPPSRALARHLRPQKRSAILAVLSQHPLCDNRKISFARPWSQARDIVLFGV